MSHKRLVIFLLLAISLQACSPEIKPEVTSTTTARKFSAPTFTLHPPTSTPTLRPPTLTLTPTQVILTATPTIIIPSATLVPVTITAVKGNLFIRRGPDLAYNAIGVLYKGTTTAVYMRDVLSKWAQIAVPNSDKMGWVSLQTEYSKVTGDLGALPQFTITEWPQPSYVRNCTHHRIVLYPGQIFIDSEVFEPENIAWVYPGTYRVFDLDMPDPVEIDSVTTSEGNTVDVRVDGTGDRHKCEQ